MHLLLHLMRLSAFLMRTFLRLDGARISAKLSLSLSRFCLRAGGATVDLDLTWVLEPTLRLPPEVVVVPVARLTLVLEHWS